MGKGTSHLRQCLFTIDFCLSVQGVAVWAKGLDMQFGLVRYHNTTDYVESQEANFVARNPLGWGYRGVVSMGCCA